MNEKLAKCGFKMPKWWSCSSACTFANCPRKWFYKKGLSLAKSETEHPALRFGRGIHCGIPLAHRGDIEGAIEAFEGVWEDGDDLGDALRTLSRAKMVLRDYCNNHTGGKSIFKIIAPPSSGVETSEKISDDEVAFSVDLGIDVPVVGRIDAVGRHRDTDELMGIEYKTSREVSTRFLSSFDLCPQVLTYGLVLNIMSDEVCVGVIVEGIQVAKTKSGSLAYPVYVTESQCESIVEWYRWQWGLLKRYTEEGEFPRNLSGCTPYSEHGMIGYPCEYLQLCRADDWRDLESMYVRVKEHQFVIPKAGD